MSQWHLKIISAWQTQKSIHVDVLGYFSRRSAHVLSTPFLASKFTDDGCC